MIEKHKIKFETWILIDDGESEYVELVNLDEFNGVHSNLISPDGFVLLQIDDIEILSDRSDYQAAVGFFWGGLPMLLKII